MIGEELIESNPVSLAKVKELLSAKKKEKELNYEQDIAHKYAKKFAKVTPKEAEKMEKELSAIASLNQELVIKIVDIVPVKKEVLELLVQKSSPVPEEDLGKVLEITKKYFKEKPKK